VIAANYDSSSDGGNGTNQVTMGKSGSPIVLAPGSMGGSMTNGFTYQGNLLAGQLSVWSFTANTGDSMVVGMGDANRTAGDLDPYLRLYGPDGALLASGIGTFATEATARATNSGTFTVIAANYDSSSDGGNGTNQVTMGKSGSPIVVAPGDQGGSLTGAGAYNGSLLAGELDVWKFTACAGDSMVVGMSDLNRPAGDLDPYLRLYGPDGALLGSGIGTSTTEVTAQATNSGTFTVIAANYDSSSDGGDGGYQLTANGLSDGFKACSPIISGTSISVSAVGGTPGTNAVLLTTTNLTTPAALWTPILTNQFDQFGVFNYSNVFNPAEPQRFFRLSEP